MRRVAPWTPAALTVLLLAVGLVSDHTNGYLVRSARHAWVFVTYEVVLAAVVLGVCLDFYHRSLGRLRAPGEVLRDIRSLRLPTRLDESIRATRAGLLESKRLFATDNEQAMRNARIVINVVYGEARRALDRVRRRTLGNLLMSVGCVVVLLSLAAEMATAFYGDSVAFRGLSAQDGLLRHFYYVSTTVMTLGFDDIVPAASFGYFFVATCSLLTLFILTVGIGFIVSHWYYVVERLDRDLKQELSETVRELAIPRLMVQSWLQHSP